MLGSIYPCLIQNVGLVLDQKKKKNSPLKFGSSSFLEVRTYDLDVA